MEKLTWNTEFRKLSQLKGYSKNPRQISKEQFQHLLNSMEKFDYVELVAIDQDNTIIAGHMRVKALKKLKKGSENIEVRVPSRKLTEEEFREYLIRSNRNKGDFDFDILANEWEPLDLLKWGFTEDQILGSCKEAEKVLEKNLEEENSSKKKKECPNCGHQFSK
jgi:ParB-like chromosome segregation protein Spo0J